MQYKYVFIDVDNTILDFDAYVKEALCSGFEKFKLGEYTEDTYRAFERENNALWEALERREIDMQQLMDCRFNRVFDALGICGDGHAFEKYFRACLNESAIPVKGAIEAVRYLHGRGYSLCAASNGPYKQQLHRLEKAGISDLFTCFFISEDIGASKPSGQYFAEAFSRLPEMAEPSECLMIGDSLSSDMAGALGCGMKTCFYNRSGKAHDRKFDYEISSMEEIMQIL